MLKDIFESILLLLSDKRLYYSLISIAIMLYGSYLFLRERKRRKMPLIFAIAGFLSLLIIVISTILRHDFLTKVEFDRYLNDVTILENIAKNPSVKFDTRVESARKVYLTTGKKIEYLNGNGQIKLFQVDPVKEKERESRLQDHRRIIYTLEKGILTSRMLLGFVFIILLVYICFIISVAYKRKQKVEK